MSFLALDMPERDSDIGPWLERQLLGLQLADLIASLEVCQPPAGERPPLAIALDGKIDAVLQQGLAAVSPAEIRTLLQHPRLLLPLQEQVLLQGGEHWQKLAPAPQHQRHVDECFSTLEQRLQPERGSAASAACGATSTRSGVRTAGPALTAIAGPARTVVAADDTVRGTDDHSTAVADPLPPPATVTDASGGTAVRRRTLWRQLLTVAALLVLGFVGWQQFQGSPAAASGWGWDKPGALATNLPAPAYLEQIARGANDWFNQRPETAIALQRRLKEFRHGCDTLLAAPHTPLAAADRAWLLERCRAWRDKIDGHLAALQAGNDVGTVRDEADATIHKLIDALETRARQVG